MFAPILLTFIYFHVVTSLDVFTGAADQVKSLPGLKTSPNFRHYSGYLNATADRRLFYWFIESQNQPTKDPIIQWLSGGPGEPSTQVVVIGAVGPWKATDNGKKLLDNPLSWNKNANLLFIDSPVGVQFSYEFNSSYIHDDNTTAKDQLLALQSFFAKFPQYRNNSFYLTGVSYAGIYIPHLAREIVRNNNKGNKRINLKGVAIANGAINGFEKSAITALYLQHMNGLIDRNAWKQLHDGCECSENQPVGKYCYFFKSVEKTNCKNNLTKIFKDVYHPLYVYVRNRYNVTYDYVKAIQSTPPLVSAYNMYKQMKICKPKNQTSDESFDWDLFKQFYFPGLISPTEASFANESEDCLDAISIMKFIGDPKVRDALHVVSPKNKSKPFKLNLECFGPYKPGCSYKVHLDSEEDIFKEIIASKQLDKIIIYTGNWDLACDYLSSEWLLNELKLPIVQEYRQWIFDNRVAGYTKRFGGGVEYVMVRGAGHTVQFDKPKEEIEIINSMVNNKPLN